MARRQLTALWTVLAVVFAVVSSLVVGLAVNAVPKSWGWAHNWWLLIGISVGLLAAAVLIAVVQARFSQSGQKAGSVAHATQPRWSPVAGSNTGVMISAKKVIIGAAGAAEPGHGSPAPVANRLGAGNEERAGDTLPPRNPAFTGRDDTLAEVERRLAGGPVAVVAVRGLGGMGKSQVALEYAHRMRDSGRCQLAGWVRADSVVTAAEDLAALAPLLGVAADGPAGEVAASVVAALRARRDWLVVFDNAQLPGDLVRLLPGGGGHVLITSRNRAWSGVAAQLDLEVFSRAESVQFLCKRSGRLEYGAAGEVAEELGDLPLALAQAAAYIDSRAVTISGYLALYRDPALAQRLRDEGLDSGEYPASVARTWLLTFGQLSGDRPAAIELLRLCAFLDPDDIDLDILATGATKTGEILAAALGDPLERTETVGALARTSLVTATAHGRLRVHRLVQAVTRDQLHEGQTALWSRRALNLIEDVFPGEPQDPQSWPVCASVAPHVEAVAAHTERYPDLALKRGRLLGQLGIYLDASAQFTAALSVLERALAIEEGIYQPDAPQLVIMLEEQWISKQALADLHAARTTLERALAIREAAYGPSHPQVVTSLNELGVIQRRLGDLPAARAALERALAIEEAHHTPDRKQLTNTLTNLSAVQRELGDLPAARAALEHALAIEEAHHTPDHYKLANTLTSLGVVQRELGDLPAARAALERALAIVETQRPIYDFQLARTLNELCLVQQELGELSAARATLRRALASEEAARRSQYL